MQRAVAIRHVAFEDLGSFAPVLDQRGFATDYVAAAGGGLDRLDPLAPDLLVVLGGPIGVYEADAYPFLTRELHLLHQRLEARRPTLGICLGAQLIARALGANVYAGTGKEIGWAPLTLTEAGMRSPLQPLGTDCPVLHWHGDSFDLPIGAELLASTPRYRHQAFALGKAVLALQFHPEVTAEGLEHWYVGHACEIGAMQDLTVAGLRGDGARHAPRLARRGAECLTRWLDALGL